MSLHLVPDLPIKYWFIVLTQQMQTAHTEQKGLRVSVHTFLVCMTIGRKSK